MVGEPNLIQVGCVWMTRDEYYVYVNSISGHGGGEGESSQQISGYGVGRAISDMDDLNSKTPDPFGWGMGWAGDLELIIWDGGFTDGAGMAELC